MAPSLRTIRSNPPHSIPLHFQCPISLDLMKDPVILSTGITYDRQSIEKWLDDSPNQTCPVTNQLLTNLDLTPNHALRKMIQDWCVTNKSLGVERIPMPRAPVTPAQVADMLADVELASWQKDRVQLLETLARIKTLTKGSERNARCISSNGCAKVLATVFSRLTSDNVVCTEILSILTAIFPFDDEVRRLIGAPAAIKSLVSILRTGYLASRVNCMLVVKEIAADKTLAAVLGDNEGLIEAIVKLIREPISPRATKAALVTAYYFVNSSSQRAIERFVELGLVSLMLEIIIDSDKSICEKALGVLDGVLSNQHGKVIAYDHALTMPVLVKKLLRVSEMATEFSVSAIWKLLKNCDERTGRVLAEEALSVGAFQKLLLLLQVGCNVKTKEKASNSLKMLNGWRGKGECIESADFKGLKRNFLV